MSDEPPTETLFQLFARWSDSEALSDSARLRLICRQPQNGAHAYLHRLYSGLSKEEIAEIEGIVGQSVPPRLRQFYTTMNGARLFEGQVSISGLVGDFSRDPTKEIPICVEQVNLSFAALRSEWHRQDYFRIGGISFLRQDDVICGPDDRVIVLHEKTGEPLRAYQDVFACLESFTRDMSEFWTDEGIFTGDWGTIDRLLLLAYGKA
jgi:hypothetical protein